MPPEVTASYNLSITGFDKESGEALNKIIQLIIEALAPPLDLSGLDGITITPDYAAALLELDRGREGLAPLTPSETFASGVAMTPAVFRQGKVKSHVIIHADCIAPLIDPDDELHDEARYLLVHELAHVHDRSNYDKCFPGEILQAPVPHTLDGLIGPIAEKCWSEFIACFLSGAIYPKEIDKFEEVFLENLQTAASSLPEEVAKYLATSDHSQFMQSGIHFLGPLATHASYLIGHAKALHLPAKKNSANTIREITKFEFLEPFENISDALDEMFEAYPKWTDKEVYRPLINAVLDCFEWANIYVSETPEGPFVSTYG